MPTAKPRITITLSDEQHTTLQALAHIQSVSMSSIIVDLLDTTLPVLQRLTAVLENASQAPQAVLDSLRATLDSAQHDMSGHVPEVMKRLNLLVSVSGGADAGDAGASGAPAEAPTAKPPTSNRGVRNVPPTSKNRSISPSKSRSYVDSNERAKK